MEGDGVVAHTCGSRVLLVLLSVLQVSVPYSAARGAPPPTPTEMESRTNCPVTQGEDHLNSFLWTIKRDVPSYFFGTIHVPYTRVWNFVPRNAKTAFERADSVYCELDLLDHETILALNQCQLLPRGELLSDVIPRDLYRRLKRHLAYVKVNMPAWMSADQKGRGMYADYLFEAITGNWERKRPVYVMLMINSLTESDIRSRGTPVLDLYLAQEAERLDKHKGALELVEEHCVPLNELNLSQVLFALNYTLWQQESRRLGSPGVDVASSNSDDIVYQYNCGDLNLVMFNHNTAHVPYLLNDSLTPDELGTARQIDDYFRLELIYKRNVRMVERVDRLLKEYPQTAFFFALGAGHLIGNDSVIDLLQQKHYDVVHTPSSELIQNSDSKHKLPRPLPYPSTATPSDGQTTDHTGHHGTSRTHRQRSMVRHERQRNSHWTSVSGLGVTDSNHLKRSQFNDLWVKLESTSHDSDTFLEQQMALTAMKHPLPDITNTASRHTTSCCSLSSILTVALVLLIAFYEYPLYYLHFHRQHNIFLTSELLFN